jgi:hypothetical protein
MGHCGKLVMRYGPLRQIGYTLWATAANLVVRYGPLRKILLYAMGHSEKPITIAQNYATVFKSLPYRLKGQ